METVSKICLFALGIFFCINANAQTYAGLKLGIKTSSVSAMAAEDAEDMIVPIGSLTFGARLEHHLSRKFILQSGVEISARGYAINFVEEARGASTELYLEERMGYVDVPIALKYHLGSDAFGLNLTAGTTLGFAMAGERNGYAAVSTEGLSEREDMPTESIDFVEEDYNRFNVGVIVGTGILWQSRECAPVSGYYDGCRYDTALEW
ncbi:MAG: porin family protein [Bacteroidota bacterium]